MRKRWAAGEYHPELRRYSRLLPTTLVNRTTVRVFRRIPQWQRLTPGTSAVTLSSGAAIRVHRPPRVPDAEGAALLWIHGGGYVLGNAAMDDKLCRRWSDELGVLVASVDYRLAPENPYPAALDDCYEALAWLAGQPEVDAGRIGLAGASAGGGLTAALALLARDRGDIDVAAQVLIYPMLDDRTADVDDPRAGIRRMWNRASSALAWRSYLGEVDPATAVPARRNDLAGLPPAWIGVGELDVLYDEACTYGERLQGAGVMCRLEVVPGAFHGFDAVAPKTAVAKRFFASQCEMLRSNLGV